MMKFLRAAAVAAFAMASSNAMAGPITVGQVYGMGFDGVGTSLRDTTGITLPSNPAGIDPGDPPWTFSLATGGILTVVDLFVSGDVFEIFNFGGSIGLTSSPSGGGTCGSDVTCA